MIPWHHRVAHLHLIHTQKHCKFARVLQLLAQKDTAQLGEGFTRLGLEYIPSHGNFITVRIGQGVPRVYGELLAAGVIVRPIAGYGMPEHLRVTVGLP